MSRKLAGNALIWSSVDNFMRRGVQFIVSVVLARLLAPEEFGTIALLYLFTGLASAFVDTGFSSALIQRQDVTREDESTVFWFNLSMGAVASLLLFLAAPHIADFYQVPILRPLTVVMALNIFVGSLGSIHGALLTKRLDFRTLTQVGALAGILSSGFAILLAWDGYGVWALAFQALSATVLATLFIWFLNPWRPTWTFKVASARKLFGFGGYMMGATLLGIVYDRAYTLLIGRIYGTSALGFYSRADTMMHQPADFLTSVLSSVSFPILSSVSNDKDRLRRATRQIVRTTMLINVPALIGLSAVAKPLTVVLLGPIWSPAAPILQVLCLAGAIWPLHIINLTVLMAQGHSQLFFRIEIVKRVLGLTVLSASVFFGVMGIAWGQVVFGVAAFGINSYYTRKYLDYGPIDQLLDILPAACVSALMWAVLWQFDFSGAPSALRQTLYTVGLGLALYVPLISIWQRGDIRELKTLLLSRK
ncbi:MAG: lipopolysaccharide biosynthesis protein [Parvibaculum sp.]|uniref:lipopolysaccharide biosynthesis protein n=1 Tax=Parvibaculum sp. TaxID=2024848 RepID=UPI00284AFC90|nr:lipopolysaccharide biosynthesis protein [Parvibaculum sp.]MDR3499401.1 lipopolysaccharide biosynthesis protein [Parvibaculum sp.]